MSAIRAGRWIAASAAAAVLMAAGCSVATSPSPTSEPPASPVATGPAPIRSIPPSPARSTATPPSASATPIPGLAVSGPVPLSRLLLICERWGENPPDTVIGCRDGASMAFAALGPDRSASIRRLDVTYGSSCPASGACAARRPDVVDVTAHLDGDGGALAVRVARVPSGDLVAWPATSASAPPAAAFDVPTVAAPAIDGATPAVRDREPLPFCGDEDATAGGFDVAARRCFLDGIRSGSPVELISRSASTEGDPLVTLYRWTGTGSVVKAVQNAAGWVRAVCAITPVDTDAAFVLTGGCDPVGP